MTTQTVQDIRKQAPGERRAHSLDWVDELNGQTIASASWATNGLSSLYETIDGSFTSLYLSGVSDQTDYIVTCTVVTSANEIIVRSFLIEGRKL